jgi:amino acid adenylation domain-containing protein
VQLGTTAPSLRSESLLAEQTFDLTDATLAAAGALAIDAPDGRLTRGELREWSATIAGWLRDAGVDAGDLVGLCIDRSAALVAAAVAARQAGAAYVALDPVHPARRLQHMLADSGAAAVLFGPGHAARLGLEPVAILPGGLELAQLPGRAPVGPAPGLAYVVYTSGSTGAPKGVLVTQAGLDNLVSWHCRAFEITAEDRCTQIASPGFDAFAWEVWPCLAAGASLHVPPAAARTDAVALRDWLVAEQITVSFLPTPLAEAVLALEWPAETRLRVLLTGGDRLQRAPRPGLPFTVVNNYGVSEATVVSTSGVVPPNDSGAVPTIGRPIDGVVLRVVNDSLDEVADGEPGELLIGGVSLARGYLGRPDLTTAAFVTAPYPGSHDERWYRTGDLVRRLPNGELEYVGRRDDQVKIRGNRVEPSEVAAVLDRHPDVAKTVVLAVPDGAGGTSLVAFLRGYRAPVADQQIRDFAADRLPTAMLPAHLVWVETFPVTPNGKIDRAALAERALPAQRSAPADATDEVQRIVSELVADVLGLAAVSPSDNFILLGGDSLLAARLMVRIEDNLDVELPLRTVFEHPTIIELAAEVRRLTAAT